MRAVATGVIALIMATNWSGLASATDGPPALSHNPFSRPPSERLRIEPAISSNDDGSIASLPLHATMVGHVSRLANVAGRILKPGDEYQGYRLVTIHEQYAVFERDGRSMTVYVKPLFAEDDGRDEEIER